jgi:hypothetical protein
VPSQITFQGKYVNIKDNEVVFLLHALLEALPEVATDDWYQRVRDTWKSRLSVSGFGLYGLDLEKLVTGLDEKKRMLQVFEIARTAILSRGPYLKKEWLNSLDPREAIYYQDQESIRFVGKLNEIEDLLRTAQDV